MYRIRWIALVAAIALLVSACSDDDDDGGGAPVEVDTTVAGVPSSSPDDTTTSTPALEPASVRVVSQNLLHGIACPEGTDGCRMADRVALFVRQLGEAECPELVSVQESNQPMVDVLTRELPNVCDATYRIVWDEDPGIDREVILTTLDVVDSRRLALPGGFRTAYFVRVATEAGLLDYVSTHLASSSDDRPCDSDTCPPPCSVDDRLNACQAKVILAAIDELSVPGATVVLGGDLNARIDEPTLAAVLEAGFEDAHLLVGNAECDAVTGAECTSGRDDASLDDLTDPASQQNERIDYVLVRSGGPCTVSAAGLFNGDPAVGDPTGLVHPADHTGVFATLSCPVAEPTDVTDATLPPTTTTTVASGGGVPDAETADAITEGWFNLLDGSVDDAELKLASLEDAELLREIFLASFEANREIASQISLRIDEIVLTAPDRADVTYALLLDEAVVVGPQNGESVLVDGAWLVSRRSYCDLSLAGAEEIPEPCR